MSQTNAPVKKYAISISRESEKIAIASAHGTTLRISMSGGEPELGLTSPETVIAAYGACIMTNIGSTAKALGLKIDDVKIDFAATKRNEPLGIENIRCTIKLKSDEPADKLRALLDRATTNGTGTNAINEGIKATFDYIFNEE